MIKKIYRGKKKSLRLTVCGLPSLGEVARIGEQPRGNGRAQTLYRGGHEAPIFPTLASWNPHTSISASREAMISSWGKEETGSRKIRINTVLTNRSEDKYGGFLFNQRSLSSHDCSLASCSLWNTEPQKFTKLLHNESLEWIPANAHTSMTRVDRWTPARNYMSLYR